MRTDDNRLLAMLLHGWVELLTLFVLLYVALLLWGLVHARGLRPAERGAIVPVGVLIAAFGMLLLLRYTADAFWEAVVLAAGMVLAGLLSSQVRPHALWLPSFLLAGLLGLGLNLSALVLGVAVLLALLFRSGRDR
jgi:hypothetical protein